MKKHHYIILTITICIGFICGSCKTDNSAIIEEEKEPEIISEVVKTKDGARKLKAVSQGKKMQHGSLVNLNDREINTQSFEGKSVVINLWATWCSPCLTDTPEFQKTANEYSDATFISVSIDRNKSDWSLFIKENNWLGNHYWIGMDDSNPIYSFAYSQIDADNVQGVHVTLPKYIIISPDGTIEKSNFVGPGAPQFKKVLDEHLL